MLIANRISITDPPNDVSVSRPFFNPFEEFDQFRSFFRKQMATGFPNRKLHVRTGIVPRHINGFVRATEHLKSEECCDHRGFGSADVSDSVSGGKLFLADRSQIFRLHSSVSHTVKWVNGKLSDSESWSVLGVENGPIEPVFFFGQIVPFVQNSVLLAGSFPQPISGQDQSNSGSSQYRSEKYKSPVVPLFRRWFLTVFFMIAFVEWDRIRDWFSFRFGYRRSRSRWITGVSFGAFCCCLTLLWTLWFPITWGWWI